jgi:hypothetical protein
MEYKYNHASMDPKTTIQSQWQRKGGGNLTYPGGLAKSTLGDLEVDS